MKIIKKPLSLIVTSIILVMLVLPTISVNMAKAEGEVQITTWAELHAIRNNLAGDYILMNDLDETTEGYATYAGPAANGEAGWEPIGTTGTGNQFTGSFDGNNHTISGLYIYRPATGTVGLFGYASGADLNNIILEDVSIVGHGYVGSLVGYNLNSSISTSSASSGDITGTENNAGGLVGGNIGGSISNSYSTCSVSGNYYVGGLVGLNYGSISNSYSTGSVSASDDYVGGLVGHNSGSGSVSNSYSTGSVSGSNRIGGLVGHNDNIISNSYSIGTVSGTWYVGGLAGLNYGPISKSYSTGIVLASNYVGGLVGGQYGGSINYSFWDIDTSGQETSGGGTGKTTDEIKTLTTFTTELSENSWDFVDTWTMSNGRNSGYPYLQSIPPEALTHTLTYTVGDNGSITGNSPQTVNDGEDGLSVTAVPSTGYHFVNWSDDSTDNPRTDINVTEDIYVTANFAINTYSLSYLASDNGLLAGTSSQTVNYGSNGTEVTAVPSSNYAFVKWSDDSYANPRTDLNVTRNISVTAMFAIIDLEAPVKTVFKINNGATHTKTKVVTLSIEATDAQNDVTHMIVCSTPSFTNCEWETYATTKAWTSRWRWN